MCPEGFVCLLGTKLYTETTRQLNNGYCLDPGRSSDKSWVKNIRSSRQCLWQYTSRNAVNAKICKYISSINFNDAIAYADAEFIHASVRLKCVWNPAHVSTVQKVLSLISALWTETNTVPFFSSCRDTGPVATVPGARENEENPVIVVKEVKKKVSKRVRVCVSHWCQAIFTLKFIKESLSAIDPDSFHIHHCSAVLEAIQIFCVSII